MSCISSFMDDVITAHIGHMQSDGETLGGTSSQPASLPGVARPWLKQQAVSLELFDVVCCTPGAKSAVCDCLVCCATRCEVKPGCSPSGYPHSASPVNYC